MNRLRLILHRLFRKPALTGPMRLYTRRIPDGVLVDLEEYFVHVIETLADDPDAYALFQEVVDDRATTREHDGWEPEQLLVERLAEHVGHEVPVRGEALARLADKFRAAAPKTGAVVAIPSQARRAA
ncbi:hypothetical protein [Streptomyces sp. BK340]|uniref:hypothetical protein n=1 Tax=Streptomyces sp. BK340 TaxID=2572903 RepID=UPI0011A87E9B|nr:hypothetical protein [Streptomyces sp. BK340]TVZ96458.1 hypothetical protein FB157_103369 [Streptomyces sp. BK340]